MRTTRTRGVWNAICFVLAVLCAATSSRADPASDAIEFNRLTNDLASQFQAGRLDEAIQTALQARDPSERAFGPLHSITVLLVNQIAQLYLAKGMSKTALPLLEQDLAIIEKTPNPDYPDLMVTLSSLAALAMTHARHGATSLPRPASRRQCSAARTDARLPAAPGWA